jgi:hypothetical protein
VADNRARDWAAIFGVLAAFLALGVSAYTYYRGAQAQAEAEAVGVLQQHWQLAINHEALASLSPESKCERYLNDTREGEAFDYERDCKEAITSNDTDIAMRQYEHYRNGHKEAILDNQYAWFASHALFTADTGYDLSGGEKPWYRNFVMWFPGQSEKEETRDAWNDTIKGLLDTHDTYVLNDSFSLVCDEYEVSFVEFVEEHFKEPNLCPSVGTSS